jgi:hypothetical protein
MAEIIDSPVLLTQEELHAVAENVRKLLANIGDSGICKGCHREIFWVKHRNGKAVPYTPQGLNHFIDCPQAKEFKR